MPADGGYVRLSVRSRPAADFAFHIDLGINELVRCLVFSILSSFTTVQTRHDETVNPYCEGMEGVLSQSSHGTAWLFASMVSWWRCDPW